MPSKKRKISQLDRERRVAERIRLIERISQKQYSSDALRSSKNFNDKQYKKSNLIAKKAEEDEHSIASSESDFEHSPQSGPHFYSPAVPAMNNNPDTPLNTTGNRNAIHKKSNPDPKISLVHANDKEPVSKNDQSRQPVKPSPVTSTAKAFYLNVNRKEEFELSRASLPVVSEEQRIMEAIQENDIVFLCAETGSGKTTQVPQFLYEAGFGDLSHPIFSGMIGVTQPRRIAAITTAARVAQELNVPLRHVSHQVRYDKKTVGPETRIKFMTDGILVRELTSSQMDRDKNNAGGLLLTQYSCIIIDEAHERTINTDLLIGWLTRLVRFRNSGKVNGVKPLKVIIMSASLEAQEIIDNPALFPGDSKPPLITVPGRQYKVAIHYNRVTPDRDYLTEAYKKILKIHTRLPNGTILVFVTGRSEVQCLVRKLKQRFNQEESSFDAFPEENDVEYDIDSKFENDANPSISDSYDSETEHKNDEEDEVHFLGDIGEEPVQSEESLEGPQLIPEILPLYSLLPEIEQMKIFEPVKEGQRRIVIATNIAETSITIPGVKYVVDCGKVKEKYFDSGIERFRISWTSKASADQRAGRAGRLGPGHCYRLFSSAVFDQFFEKQRPPEISRSPIEGVVLALKSVGIDKIDKFPLPSVMDMCLVQKAESLLLWLDALEMSPKGAIITPTGKALARFPTDPRYGKMIYTTVKHFPRLIPHMLALISGLVTSPIFEESDVNQENIAKVLRALDGKAPCSDFIRIISAIGAYSFAAQKRGFDASEFCKKHGLRMKAFQEIQKLRAQLLSFVETWQDLPVEQSQFVKSLHKNFTLPPLNDNDKLALSQIALSAFSDQVGCLEDDSGGRAQRYQLMRKDGFPCRYYIHRSSCFFGQKNLPKWILYTSISGRDEHLSIDNVSEDNSTAQTFWLKGICGINPSWLAHLGSKQFFHPGKVLDEPPPTYKPQNDSVVGYISPTYGPHNWPLPMMTVPLPSLQESCAVFMKAFLEGLVKNTRVGEWTSHLIVKPNVICKSWARSQPRVARLLSSCIEHHINSEQRLLEKWRSSSSFLIEEILLWYKPEFHEKIRLEWPPMSTYK